MSFETLNNWECFDADSGKDLAVEIREYFIPDFSNWKDHDSYKMAFERLVKDLEAPSQKTSEPVQALRTTCTLKQQWHR
jgi:hypothetical protein